MESVRGDLGADARSRMPDLEGGPRLGSVVRLSSTRIEVAVAHPDAIPPVTVSDLVALPAGGQFLIGIVEAVSAPEAPAAAADDGAAPAVVELRVMPVGMFRSKSRDGAGGFVRGASAYPHIGAACHLVAGDRLHALMTTLGGDVAARERLELGHYLADEAAPAIADGNRLFQRHVAFLGSTGTGKSWGVALILERAAKLNHANLVVFDLHGEYWPLTEKVPGRDPVARGLRVAGPGDLGRSNGDLLHLPYWLLERDELMTLVADPTDPHASDQTFRFTEHMLTLKHIALSDAERHAALRTFAADSPIPYRIDHLLEMLKADDTEKIPVHPGNRVEPGTFTGRLTGLITRLEARLADPRYAFIFNPPPETFAFEWLADTAAKLLEAGPGKTGIKILDLSEVPSAIAPLVAGVLARVIYELQFWMEPVRRSPVCLVCDEAHLYLPTLENSGPVHRAAVETFEAIAKEGRKYGVGLLVVSQRPSDVSRTILSQCHNFVIMRVTNDHDRGMIERLIPETFAGVTGALPVLDVGEAIVIGDALPLPSPIKLDAPAVPPASGTQPYWSLWSQHASSRDAIADGAEALRNQFRAGR